MPKYSKTSLNRLSTCHVNLIQLFKVVIRFIDCTILCGHRSQAEQDKAYRKRRSTKKWPLGKHNSLPSEAVDVAPYPIDWKNRKRFYFFAGFVLGVAAMMGIKIRWGGDWDSDKDLDDQNLYDLPHFEILN